MEVTFDLQLFGGGKGGSQTTNNNYRPLTADELRMQKASADYAESIQPSAYKLFQTAMAGTDKAVDVNPDYTQLYKQQADNTTNLQKQYTNFSGDVMGNIDGYNNAAAALDARNNANSQYLRSTMDQAANRRNANSGLLGADTALVNQQLRSGTIPQAMLDARQNTVNRMAQKAMGGLLSAQAANGTIGSDQYLDGLKGVSDSVANSLNDSYSQDLAQYNGSVQQSLGNTGNYVNTDNATAQQGVSNAGNWADYDNQIGQQNLGNMANGINQQYSMGNGLFGQQQALNGLGIQQANQAQNASYDMPLKLYGAATGQMQPTQQIWQPTLLSNQANPISSTTTQSGGGGGLLGGLFGAATYGLGQSWGRNW